MVGALDCSALEQFVFLPSWALGALQAANQEKGHACCDQEGKKVGIRGDPVSKNAHKILASHGNLK
jgi:hypothetical protein